jgi:hypothetical protein
MRCDLIDFRDLTGSLHIRDHDCEWLYWAGLPSAQLDHRGEIVCAAG